MSTQYTPEEQAAFENAYWNTMAKAAGTVEAQQGRDLFNAAFDDRIAKYAAADPEFGAEWQAELEKAAFNQAVEATLNQHGLTWNPGA
jgi:hypothetical protein